MRNELLTILFIRSSYKIRKVNLLFIYYQLLKYLGILFVIVFFVLLAAVFYLLHSNQKLLDKIAHLKDEKISQMVVDVKRDKQPPATGVKNSFNSVFKSIESDQITVQDLSVNTLENACQLKFKLANLSQSAEPIKGYLVVGGYPEEFKADQVVFYPLKVKVNKDRTITNFSDGEIFSIKFFKNVTVLLNPAGSFEIRNIVITIFSETGEIYCQKIANVNN